MSQPIAVDAASRLLADANGWSEDYRCALLAPLGVVRQLGRGFGDDMDDLLAGDGFDVE